MRCRLADASQDEKGEKCRKGSLTGDTGFKARQPVRLSQHFGFCNAVNLLLFTVLYCRRFFTSRNCIGGGSERLPSFAVGSFRCRTYGASPCGFPRAPPGYHRAAAFRFGFCIKKTAGRCFPLSGRGASHALFLFFLSAFAALFAACSSAASFAFSVISRAFSRFAFALASFFSSLPHSSAFPASSARVVR